MSNIKQSRLNQVYECIRVAGGVGLTAQEVAACVGLSAGGWLKAILHELEGGGWLRHEVAMVETDAGLREAKRYSVTDKVIA